MITIKQWGPKSILIQWEQRISAVIRQEVYALNEILKEKYAVELWQTIPAYCSLMLQFKITIRDFDLIVSQIQESYALVLEMDAISLDSEIVEIRVVYDKSVALDWQFLESELDMPFDQIVQLHQSVIYDVYMIGFLPGFAFLGILPDELRIPRRSTPRKRVPEGSVAIAEQQTAVYPSNSPGGWHIIGRSETPLISNDESNPILLKAGDRVRFVSSSALLKHQSYRK